MILEMELFQWEINHIHKVKHLVINQTVHTLIVTPDEWVILIHTSLMVVVLFNITSKKYHLIWIMANRLTERISKIVIIKIDLILLVSSKEKSRTVRPHPQLKKQHKIFFLKFKHHSIEHKGILKLRKVIEKLLQNQYK